MPPLALEDVAGWDAARCEKERRERIGRIDEIRKDAGGSLASVSKAEHRDEVKANHAELNVIGERADEIKDLEAADVDAKRLKEQLDTPDRKVPAPNGGDPKAKKIDTRDAGTIFANSDALKTFKEKGIKGTECELPVGSLLPGYRGFDFKGIRMPQVKATLGEDASLPNVDTDYPPQSIRTGVVVEELFQTPNVADLFPQTTINQPAVPFMRETVVDTGAAETAEGELAPEASIEFVEDSAPVRKIAVMLPVTEEILEDEQLVRGHVNGRLPQFVQMREDNQLLLGDGTGQNLEGLLHLSGVGENESYHIASSTAQEKLETIFSAAMRISEGFLTPDGVLTNLGVWEELRLAKDDVGQYLIAPATDAGAPRVWGLRVVTNQSVPAEAPNAFPIVVGAFAQSSQIWRRRNVTLAVSDSHEDNFGRGILVIKATSRLAVTHYRAAGYELIKALAS
jgi:HK97 family phage major capsid protein